MPLRSFKVNTEYAQMSQLVPGLFICGVSALTAENIAQADITMIVNATSEVPNIKSLGDVQRAKLWIDDNPEAFIYPHLDFQSDQIQTLIADKGRVLVHSVAGISRSAAICLAFLTKHRCASLRAAYLLMTSKRPMVRPNQGFWRQLITFEEKVKRVSSSVRMVPDEEQSDLLVPDVYLSPKRKISGGTENSEGSTSEETPHRKPSCQRPKFLPVLERLSESAESAPTSTS